MEVMTALHVGMHCIWQHIVPKQA